MSGDLVLGNADLGNADLGNADLGNSGDEPNNINPLYLPNVWKYINCDLKSNIKFGFNNLMYSIGAFTYLNEGWNGFVYSFVTISPIFMCAPYSYVVIAGGLVLGILYANIFTAFNWKEFISGGLGVKNNNKEATALLDKYNDILNNLNNEGLDGSLDFDRWLSDLDADIKEISDKTSKEKCWHKFIRYSSGLLTGVMYCLAAYFTTSQAVILLGFSASNVVFLPIFICCALAEGLAFLLMENVSLMKYMKLGCWVEVEDKQKELKQKLEVEKFKIESDELSDEDFEKKLEEFNIGINLDELLDKVVSLSKDILDADFNTTENLGSKYKFFNSVKLFFKKHFRSFLYLLLGSGLVLYFSDGVDGIMTCFDFAEHSLHMHTTLTFTITSVLVAVLMGLMQAIFYWGFDGGYIRREFGLSSRKLHKDSDNILDGLNKLNVILCSDDSNNNLPNNLPNNLSELEDLLFQFDFQIKEFEENLKEIDGFLERRKDYFMVRSLKNLGSGLGFLINAAAGFFCGKMLLGSLVMLGISSPPGIAVFVSVCTLCALGRVLSYAFIERKKFGEFFAGSAKRQKTFENKKQKIKCAFYKAKRDYLQLKANNENFGGLTVLNN